MPVVYTEITVEPDALAGAILAIFFLKALDRRRTEAADAGEMPSRLAL
jgi:hypothetical protein